ncbi:pirin family protein [bacterium]|nr:pirin family protein [bacterium]
MKTEFHSAQRRGHANHGWLDSYHSFSFAGFYNPDKMNFGALRVLNDDTVSGGMGFGAHPHDNMEIISIPLSGDLEHRDSMGNVGVIKEGDVQVMSAGTGIVHSEYNKNKDKEVKFLQIWIIPNQRNVEPRYDQITLNAADYQNQVKQIISPEKGGEDLWIHQDAWFSLTETEAGKSLSYNLHKDTSGVYAFVLDGEVQIEEHTLSRRDALGIQETNSFEIKFNTKSKVLIMEVPMKF